MKQQQCKIFLGIIDLSGASYKKKYLPWYIRGVFSAADVVCCHDGFCVFYLALTIGLSVCIIRGFPDSVRFLKW